VGRRLSAQRRTGGQRQVDGRKRERSPANCGSGVTDLGMADAALIPGEQFSRSQKREIYSNALGATDRARDWPIELLGPPEQRQFQHQMASCGPCLARWLGWPFWTAPSGVSPSGCTK
jgi:hypothetical protein